MTDGRRAFNMGNALAVGMFNMIGRYICKSDWVDMESRTQNKRNRANRRLARSLPCGLLPWRRACASERARARLRDEVAGAFVQLEVVAVLDRDRRVGHESVALCAAKFCLLIVMGVFHQMR